MPRPASPKSASADARKSAAPATLQSQKSAQTRLQLIEAAVRCIIKSGYANTTTPRVAAEAGLSRGAMMHHFENGPALIRAAITHLNDKRLRAFQRSVDGLPDTNDVRGLLNGYWRQINRPTFLAFHELAIAARTDKGLAAILLPAEREFSSQWYNLAVDLFPAWQSDPEKFRLALKVTQHTLEGMAINRLIYGDEDLMIEEVLDHLEQQILALRPAPTGAAIPTSVG